MDDHTYLSKDAKETQSIAADIARKCHPGTTICLYGNLGSGKTTFSKGFAKALEISDNISSPTFVILKQYRFKENNILYHFDLYRLETTKDIENIGLTDIGKDKNGIILIEWAEKAKSILPKNRIDIYFEYIDENTRKIRIRSKNGK